MIHFFHCSPHPFVHTHCCTTACTLCLFILSKRAWCIHHLVCWAVYWLFANECKLADPSNMLAVFIAFHLRLLSEHMCNLFTCCMCFINDCLKYNIAINTGQTKKSATFAFAFQTRQTKCSVWRAKKEECSKKKKKNIAKIDGAAFINQRSIFRLDKWTFTSLKKFVAGTRYDIASTSMIY